MRELSPERARAALLTGAIERATLARELHVLRQWSETRGATPVDRAVRLLVRWLQDEALADATVVTRARTLQAALWRRSLARLAAEPEWLCALRALRRRCAPIQPEGIPTQPWAQLWQQALQLHDPLRAAMLLMLLTGARFTSVREMRHGDLYLDRGELVAVLRQDKAQPASQPRRVLLPLTPQTRSLLIWARPPSTQTTGWAARPRLLPLPQRWPTGRLPPARAIRRAVVNRLAEAGWSLPDIAAWMGHATKTCAAHYLRRPDARAQRAALALL